MSEGLEALKSINEIQLTYSETKHGILNPRDICSDEFAIIEKELKALEIIKIFLNFKIVQNEITNETRLFVNCGNFKASIDIPPMYRDLLKEVLV